MRGQESQLIAMLLLAFGLCGCASESDDYRSNDYPRMSCETSFEIRPTDAGARVALMGEFNTWRPDGYFLSDDDGDGVFSGSFNIGEGRYAYRFQVGEETIKDPSNPLTVYDDDDNEHSLLVVPDCNEPRLEVIETTAGADSYRMRARFLAAAKGAPLDPASVTATIDGEAVQVHADAATGLIEIERRELAAGKNRLILVAADTDGKKSRELHAPFWVEAEPFRWADAQIYQIVTDRFRKGDGTLDEENGITRRMGGDYAGIVEMIDNGYFERYGVNTLWISPANTNADGLWPGFDGRQYESYHGYWPIAEREVDPRWGGAAALKALVAHAHANGLRVVLDVVMNHVHSDHGYFKDKRREWFNHPGGDCVCGRECSWATDIQSCWFTDYLPDLDWTNREVALKLTSDMLFWLDHFDVDGLRVDAVAMMPRMATRWLRYEAHERAELGGEHVYLIGETYTGPQGRPEIRRSLGVHGLSAQFDFPLMWAMREVIAETRGSMADLLGEADESAQAWEGSGAVMGLILGNHDVPRFMSLANGDDVSDVFDPPDRPVDMQAYKRMFLAYLFMYSLPGAPILYYGDEFGMPGAGDPDNRRPMRFEDDRSEHETWLAERVARIGRLRRELPALRHGKRTDLLRGQESIAYELSDGDTRAMIVLNRSQKAKNVTLSLPDDWQGTFRDCFGSHISIEDGTFKAIVSPMDGLFVTNDEVCDATQ